MTITTQRQSILVRNASTRRWPRARAVLAVAMGAALAATSLLGCSKAKAEIACERADNLKDGVAEISRDVRVRDLDDAREEAADLRSDFDRLQRRFGELSEANQSKIEPLLQPADDAIASLEAATTLPEMSAAIKTGRAPIEALASGVDSTLKCDD